MRLLEIWSLRAGYVAIVVGCGVLLDVLVTYGFLSDPMLRYVLGGYCEYI